ncbi:hypothetical protein [Polaribacter filamentus]|nr:hypothetical protein [Polaribacter filamentus]
MPKINPEIFMDLRDPDEVTREILGFLTTQGETAEKQFKTSRNLIIATIFIMIFQIGCAIWINYESNTKQNNLTTIIELQSKQSETISRMSLSLFDLETQVRTLEQENARLNQELNN